LGIQTKTVVIIILVLASTCAWAKWPKAHSPDELRQTLAVRLSPKELEQLIIPFEADEDIRKTAVLVTKPAASNRQKLALLKNHFRKIGLFENYQKQGTHTAREVMDKGSGNCVSYANLFISMARAVGLDAYYLDASKIRNEFERSGRYLVNVGHIMVGVRFGAELVAVDFDQMPRQGLRYDVLTDIEALADYYNNLGQELIWQGIERGESAIPRAIQAFKMAVRIHPGFAKAWNNLGVAYVKSGQPDQAVMTYKRAVYEDPQMAAPHANLGHVYYRSDNLSLAIEEFRMATRLDKHNEHYYFFLGRSLQKNNQLDQAKKALEKGIAINSTMFQLHLQLAQIYEKQNMISKAKESAKKVLKLVPNQRDASRMLRQ
jgi:tetratricopeptide (TPR) repeat protein